MYGYAITFLLVFLTHPGVAYNFFDPGIPGGIFQGLVVLALQSPSDGKASFADTMSIIYWIITGIWAYVKVQLALRSTVTAVK
jgi:hypothetical protein